MYPTEAPVTEPKSHRKWLVVGLVSFAVLLLGISIVAALALGGTKKDTANNTAATDSSEDTAVASGKEVESNKSAVDASLAQSKSDTSSAKSALEDDKKQIKVGN